MTITATTTPAPAGLEVIDKGALAAFKESTKNHRGYVLFYRWPKGDGIRITKEQRNRRGELVDPLELIDLPVSATLTAYDNDGGRRHYNDPWTASAGVWSPDTDAEWKTIVRAIHIGDTIQLEWLRGNNSQAIEMAGCVRDELRLKIMWDGKPRASFLVDVYVGPDNTARMVRL